ncbi:LLM class flavin-dependent oxidoreductase [Amycolatopsis sp. CA-126428]|uniref:LLM class flavin-dependent oxidoreductase n=1 Tax=Amycolatopsis sp. CA-126428 TaxID=2073158 RepID=UPI000CD28E2B
MSIAQLHGRRVALNLITGAALNELRSVGDTLRHEDRYARLQDYVGLLLRLLDGEPVTWNGRFYHAVDLQLATRCPAPGRNREGTLPRTGSP